MATYPMDGAAGASVAERDDNLLRLALTLDALASGALGVLAVVAGPILDDLLGIRAALLVPMGAFLVAYAVGVWLVGARARVSPVGAWAVIALNVLWTLGSVTLVLTGWLPLTPLGVAFVLVQAAAVALFADLQYLGLRRARRAGPR